MKMKAILWGGTRDGDEIMLPMFYPRMTVPIRSSGIMASIDESSSVVTFKEEEYEIVEIRAIYKVIKK